MKFKRKAELLEKVMAAIEEDDYLGFCLACGAESYDCEPDMEEGACEDCGAEKVYGAEQIVLAGLLE